MYLKSLVLKGFKSFADRSVLSLEPGITAIVGPNGSGKSNILDAVLWVLGERNARNLRGQAMEDVIFAGSSTRKQVGIAEVDLVLDNGDGTLPVEYDEVCITRRMYRSGESEYLINGTLCRRMDVLDILHDSGLGTGTHSIISQGHLDSILQSKPEDRRTLIEEAAGVLKHKQRKEKSERKLAQMDQHLLRVQDITAEVERQIKPLERKAKRALAYQGLADELTDLSLRLSVDDLRTLQNRWDTVCAREKELQSSVEEETAAAAAADAAAAGLQEQLQSQSEDAGIVADGFHRTSSASEHIDATIMLLREKKRSSLRSREEKRVQRAADARKLEQLRADHDEALAALNRVIAEKATADAHLSRVSDERGKKKDALADLRSQLAECEEEERRLTREGDELRAKKAHAIEALSSHTADGRLLGAKRDDAASRLKEIEGKLLALQSTAGESETELEKAEEADRAAQKDSAAAFSAVENARVRIEGLRLDKSKLEAQTAGYEESERASHAGNEALSWARAHEAELSLRDSLIDVLEVPQEYSTVVEELLGDAIGAWLVDDAKTARAVLSRAAHEADGGSLYILASDACPQRVALPEGCAATMLIDEIRCPEAYASTLSALLGDVAVFDTAREAMAFEKRLGEQAALSLRLVSKDGYLVDRCGLRCVARGTTEALGAVERHRRLEESRDAAAATAEQLALCESELETLEAAMRDAQKAALACASQAAQARGRNSSLHEQLSALERDADRQRIESEELGRREGDNAAALAKMRPESERIESDLERAATALEETKARIAELRQRITPLREEASAQEERYSEARLAAGTLAEREAYTERIAQARADDIATLTAHLADAASSKANGISFDAVDSVIASLEVLRRTVTDRVAAFERQMDKAREDSMGVHARIDEARRRAAEVHGRLDECTGNLTDTRIEKGRLEVQVETAVSTIEEQGISLDTALKLPPVEDRLSSEEQASKLRRRIANMGTINPDAASEYEDLKKRYDYLKTQVDDMLEARRALAKIVEVIDGRMKNDFIETFHKVDENFQSIFSELFPGGSASLSLVDENDLEHTGVEVNAQPRGKRITKMSLMSGGEKSLVAMALLFAVYRTRSTPFYILDEVEAALDDTNLRRLCAYLNAMRGRTQMIMITHQRRTMEMADVLYGMSMQADGVTKLVSQKFDQAVRPKKG